MSHHPYDPVSVRHLSAPSRTYAGDRALGGLAKELTRTDAQRVVLVCGSSMVRQSEVLDLVEGAIGSRFAARFAGVRANSPSASVDEAASLLVTHDADAVVALGGGSAIVTARAASILAAEGKGAQDLCTRRIDGRLVSPRLEAPKISQWIVPTTPTTAYAKAGAAVRDSVTDERLALFDPKARASGVFLHPAAAATAPASLARSSALNAFAMCVDGLQSQTDDPFAEAQLRHALASIKLWLPRLGESEVDGVVGVRLMLASQLAGQASDHVGTGLAQPVSHALGPRSTVGNGIVEAIMLPHVMDFNVGHADAGMSAVAESLAPGSSGSPEDAMSAVRAVLDTVGVPPRLRDVGIAQEDLQESVAHVLDDWSATTVPRPADAETLEALLRRAW